MTRHRSCLVEALELQHTEQGIFAKPLMEPHVHLYLASEFRSSQTSTCYHCCVKPVKRQSQKKRATVLKCLGCATLHSRDFNAAHVIADMFLAMQAANSSELPDWVTVDAIRQSRTMTAVTILANTKNTVCTIASNPNLDVSKNDRCSGQQQS